eukprot:1926249-Rhodomonas_salina.1
MRCLQSGVMRGTRRVSVTAGERVGTLTAVWTLDHSRISRFRQVNRAGTGSTSVTVEGANL